MNSIRGRMGVNFTVRALGRSKHNDADKRHIPELICLYELCVSLQQHSVGWGKRSKVTARALSSFTKGRGFRLRPLLTSEQRHTFSSKLRKTRKDKRRDKRADERPEE